MMRINLLIFISSSFLHIFPIYFQICVPSAILVNFVFPFAVYTYLNRLKILWYIHCPRFGRFGEMDHTQIFLNNLGRLLCSHILEIESEEQC